MLPGTYHSRAIAQSGVDWICVDGEHGNIADNQMHEAVAAIFACGVSPIVCIPTNEAWMVEEGTRLWRSRHLYAIAIHGR